MRPTSPGSRAHPPGSGATQGGSGSTARGAQCASLRRGLLLQTPGPRVPKRGPPAGGRAGPRGLAAEARAAWLEPTLAVRPRGRARAVEAAARTPRSPAEPRSSLGGPGPPTAEGNEPECAGNTGLCRGGDRGIEAPLRWGLTRRNSAEPRRQMLAVSA